MIVERGRDGRWRLSAMSRVWLWVIVCAVSLGGGGMRVWQVYSLRAARGAWRAREAVRYPVQQKYIEQIHRLNQGRHWTEEAARRELEQILTHGKPLPEGQPMGNGQRVEWEDTQNGIWIALDFADGKWTGAKIETGPIVTGDLEPTRTRFMLQTEEMRGVIAGPGGGIAPITWAAIFTVGLFWDRARRVLFEVAVGVALVATSAWLVAPPADMTWATISRNNMLPWAGAMLLANIVGLAIETWRTTPRVRVGPLCDECGYNLTGNESGICPECGTRIPWRIPYQEIVPRSSPRGHTLR